MRLMRLFHKEIGAVLTAAQQAIDNSYLLRRRFNMFVGQTDRPADECIPHAFHEASMATGYLAQRFHGAVVPLQFFKVSKTIHLLAKRHDSNSALQIRERPNTLCTLDMQAYQTNNALSLYFGAPESLCKLNAQAS